MSARASLALRALSLRSTSGAWAARRFAERNGVAGLYRLACQLHAARGVTA